MLFRRNLLHTAKRLRKAETGRERLAVLSAKKLIQTTRQTRWKNWPRMCLSLKNSRKDTRMSHRRSKIWRREPMEFARTARMRFQWTDCGLTLRRELRSEEHTSE